MRAFLAVPLGLAVLSACRPAAESTDTANGLANAGGIIVENREPKWDDGDVWLVAAEPHISVGMLDGPPHYQLFDVTAATRQSDGDIVLVDGGTREVRLYDRDGAFVKTMGGPGSGPGEFQDPVQVLVTATDEMV